MDYHKNARLTLVLRAELARKVVEQGLTLKPAAASFNVSAKTAAKWVRRYREHGAVGLGDRSSRPRCCPRTTCSPLQEKGCRKTDFQLLCFSLRLQQNLR
jgi:transposase